MSLVWKYRRGEIWYLEYAKHLGRPKKSLRTSNSRIAETIRAKEENDILLGQAGIQQGPVSPVDFSTFVTAFLEAKHNEGMAEGTQRTYVLSFNAFGQFLERSPLVHKISIDTLERFVGWRRAHGVAAKSIRNDLGALSSAFTWGMKHGYLQSNPVKRIILPKVDRRPPDYLKHAEYQALQEKLDDPYLQEIVDFYVLTGCRRGEGLAIVKDRDVDLEKRVLTIGQPKQRNYRTLPMTDELIAIIQKLARRSGTDPRLIPLTGSAIYNRFHRAVQKANIGRTIRLHSLRHTFGSWLAAEGVGQRNLQDLMGHATISTTAKYVHPVAEAVRRDMEKLKLPKVNRQEANSKQRNQNKREWTKTEINPSQDKDAA